MKLVLTLLALTMGVALGVFAIVLGEGDDSPGLQGLGVLIVLGMFTLGVRTVRHRDGRSGRPTLSAHQRTEDA
jgi:hypothetical protein